MNKKNTNKQTAQASSAQIPSGKIVPSSRTVVEDAIAAAKEHDSVWTENSQSDDWAQKKTQPD